MFHVTDEVLRQIEASILTFPPERGGALLGPAGVPVITAYLDDPAAATTAASYLPSDGIAEQVRRCEVDTGLEFKGMVHSHPDGMNHPSGLDRQAVGHALADNPHLAVFACPIATAIRPDPWRPLAGHEHELAGGRISWFAGRRRRGGATQLLRTPCVVLPIGRDLQAVAALLGGEGRDSGIVSIDGRRLLGRRVLLPGAADLTLLFGLDYPLTAPVAILGLGEDHAQHLDLRWRLDIDEPDRLVAALREHFRPVHGSTGPYRLAWGPAGSEALTTDRATGEAAGWSQVCTNAAVAAQAERTRDAALARTAGLLPVAIRRKHVLLAGAGSVGSYMAEQLVRSGIGRITLVDPEQVELPNLSRTCYRVEDVGKPKIQALASRLLCINPGLEVRCCQTTVQELGNERLEEIVGESDLLVCAIDDHDGPRVLNRFAYALGKPSVYVGIFAGARGGEVLLTVPEASACHRCVTSFRRAAETEGGTVAGRTDYGTGRLVGEVALGVDVHHVASAAVKLGLSLLLPEETTGSLRELAARAVAEGQTYLLMGMTPDYWIFPSVFRDVPGQHAFQSVWAAVQRDPACPVCGDRTGRVDPRAVTVAGPAVASIRAALEAEGQSEGSAA